MALKLTSVICVPLLDRGQLIGLIYVGNDSIVNLFQEATMRVLTVFSAQASLIVTNALLVITTLVGFDIVLASVKGRIPAFGRAVEGLPLVIVQDGKPIEHRLERARVDVADILAAGRENHGIERLDQIKYAVLEQSGSISVIPR